LAPQTTLRHLTFSDGFLQSKVSPQCFIRCGEHHNFLELATHQLPEFSVLLALLLLQSVLLIALRSLRLADDLPDYLGKVRITIVNNAGVALASLATAARVILLPATCRSCNARPANLLHPPVESAFLAGRSAPTSLSI
jgi:hypothetical protein